MASPGQESWGALLAFSEQWLRMPGAPPIRMTSKCAAGWRVGETLFIIIQAQSPIPFYIQAQSFLHGFNIFSIFQECNYVHKSQEGLLCFVQDVTVSENHATDGSTAS